MTLTRKIALAFLALFALGWLWGRYQEARKRRQGVLAVVHVYGPIATQVKASPWTASDADDIARQLHRLSENKDVRAILLRINSPGGTVGAVQEIHTELVRCKAQGKKVVASLGDIAASGGYYLASAADRIIADPGTITGSIGVVMQFGNLEGLFQKVGVRLQVIKSGEHKDIGSPARSLTPEERRLLQASLDDAYQQFVDAVREGRNLPPEKLRDVVDGRIFTGRQAMRLGLVDELGNKHDAVQAAIQLANLPAKPMILSDTSRSLSAFLMQASSELGAGRMDAWLDGGNGPLLEYRWR